MASCFNGIHRRTLLLYLQIPAPEPCWLSFFQLVRLIIFQRFPIWYYCPITHVERIGRDSVAMYLRFRVIITKMLTFWYLNWICFSLFKYYLKTKEDRLVHWPLQFKRKGKSYCTLTKVLIFENKQILQVYNFVYLWVTSISIIKFLKFLIREKYFILPFSFIPSKQIFWPKIANLAKLINELQTTQLSIHCLLFFVRCMASRSALFFNKYSRAVLSENYHIAKTVMKPLRQKIDLLRWRILLYTLSFNGILLFHRCSLLNSLYTIRIFDSHLEY